MSAIFISHSSSDNAVAAELRARLAAHGHRSVFLDFDPGDGIPAGRDWERELYAQLRACQAVVVLCSAASVASRWCFAEITHARALGKPLFPLTVEAGAAMPLVADVQVTDLTVDRERGFERLFAGLRAAGLDPAALFDWDGSRPPYPGLLAFQQADAAVYFGRDVAIQGLLETLQRLRRTGGPRLLLLLGASGSGKSSLLRAGVLPRLERDLEGWRVAPPLRPLAHPLDSLAVALGALPGAAPWKAIRASLEADATSAAPRGWSDLVGDVRSNARRDVSLLVAVDQLEEALGLAPAADGGPLDEHAAFLRLLRLMTADPGGPLFVVATLRSDFLGAFQTHPELRGVAYEPVHLPQLALADIAQVIEGPARVAGIELEPGLAAAMVADTATDDALPLLAFALREMFDRFGGGLQRGGRLTVEQYRTQLGGLQGALARAAEAVCGDPARSAAELDALRRALLGLVRVDTDGRFVRRPRRWNELPQPAFALLERLVQARLLVSRSEQGGEPVLEVAHEALFRSWSRLAAWLAADREFLLWRERLHAGSDEWQRNGRDASLLLRGPVLAEAQRWRGERGDDLDETQRGFIDASLAARAAADAARERRRRRLIGGLVAAVLVFGGLAGLAEWQREQAGAQRRLALARQLNIQADVEQPRAPVRGLLLTAQSLQTAWTPDGHAALLGRIDSVARPQPSRWKAHPGAVRAMALGPGETGWLVTAGQQGLQAQSRAGEVRTLEYANHHDYFHAVAFSPQGDRLAATCETRIACVYETTTWKPVLRLPPVTGSPTAVAFGADGRTLASGSHDSGQVRLHAMPGGEPLPPLETKGEGVRALAFSPDGRLLAVGTRKDVQLWRVAGRARVGAVPIAGVSSLAFSPDGHWLAVSGQAPPAVLELKDAGDGDVAIEDKGAEGPGLGSTGSPFMRIAFSSTGRHVAATDERAGLRWMAAPRSPLVTLGPGHPGALAADAGGRFVAAAIDGHIETWDPEDNALRRVAVDADVAAVALGADSRQLAVAMRGGDVAIVDTADGREMRRLHLPGDVTGLAFSASGGWLGVVHGTEVRLADLSRADAARIVGPLQHDGEVTGLRFDAGGARLATTTRWDAPGGGRTAIRRPTRTRVWDIGTAKELGWRFEIEQDLQQPMLTILARRSLEEVRETGGGDVALANQAAAWPVAFPTDARTPTLPSVVPERDWLLAESTNSTSLFDLAVRRTQSGSGLVSFGSDGRLLASANGREARLWPLRPEDLVAEACVRLPRNLDCSEWRQAMGDDPYRKTCPALPAPPEGECKRSAGQR